jgi:hypothetical protein
MGRFSSSWHRVSQEERSVFWEVTVSVILSKKVYMYVCPIANDFRDRAISLYSTKIPDKQFPDFEDTSSFFFHVSYAMPVNI